MVLALGLQSFYIADSFLITIFVEFVQHILSIIAHIFGDDNSNMVNKGSLGFVSDMM